MLLLRFQEIFSYSGIVYATNDIISFKDANCCFKILNHAKRERKYFIISWRTESMKYLLQHE